jgi:DNA repair protein RadC
MAASSLTLHDQPVLRESPLVKCITIAESVALYGSESLSDAQIIEAMLNRARPGRAEEILLQAVSLGHMVAMGPAELRALGLTKAEMARFAVLQEVHRRSTRGGFDRPRITSPRAAGSYLLPKIQGWTEERFGMLALNAKGDLLADRVLAHGTAIGCLISPREFFREALRYGATTALAWHNHPSGDTTPSPEDIQFTNRLRSAGESLGVPLADHMVLGHDSWHSFRSSEGWDRG